MTMTTDDVRQHLESTCEAGDKAIAPGGVEVEIAWIDRDGGAWCIDAKGEHVYFMLADLHLGIMCADIAVTLGTTSL